MKNPIKGITDATAKRFREIKNYAQTETQKPVIYNITDYENLRKKTDRPTNPIIFRMNGTSYNPETETPLITKGTRTPLDTLSDNEFNNEMLTDSIEQFPDDLGVPRAISSSLSKLPLGQINLSDGYPA